MMPAKKLFKKPRVLVIEDNELLRIIHKITLELMGFECVLVENSEQAIACWAEHWDLIFSDIGLPGMNGNELCKKRREYEKQHGIYTPAFAYTAFGNTMRQECLAAGFDGFGVKPLSNEELFNELNKLLPEFQLTSWKTQQ